MASITKKLSGFWNHRKYHADATSPLTVVLACHKQSTGQLFEGPQRNSQFGVRSSPDEDYSAQTNAHGSRSSAAAGELAFCRRDECHAVIPSARPLRSLKGLIMGHSVQDIGNTDPPSGDGQMANQLPGIEERRAPLPNVQPGVDCGVLSFFGRPMWYSDFAADQNIFIQPEEVDGTERGCSIRPSTPTPPSNTPLPAALFGHVALFLGAEDVVALASACKSLRWIGFHRDAWKSLCFSEGFVSYSPLAATPRRPGTRVAGKRLSCAKPSYVLHPGCNAHLYKGSRRRGSVGDGCFRLDSGFWNPPHAQDWPLCGGPIRRTAHPESFSYSSDISQRRDVDWSDAALSCEGELGRRDSPSESRAYPSAPTDMAWEAETRCRGLQVLPECTLHELVDWRFLYLLNRVSPGPRIHVHVRELELQFPMYPVVPDTANARRCSTAGGAPPCEGQECCSGEHENQRQSKSSARKRWLRPQEFVSTFIHRALNISQPMRLRHLRPGNRPGLCVAEILREQHYLLEWQVPLRFLQEPSAHSTRFIAEAQNDSTPVWPLPPYGSLELDSLAQLGGNWRRQERMAVHNVVDEDRPHSSQRAPEVDAVHDDRLIFDVLDRGSVFASLLSPLSFGTTAAAIFVGALLVAVATSSAAAAITTAAAATATLAARRSRIFRVDLHVLERDEHEDDQEEVVECDISQSLLVSSFSGSLGMPPRQLATSGYDSHIQVVNEAASCGSGPQSVCGPVSSGSEEAVGDQGGSYVSNNLRLRLPCLRRLFQDQLARLFRSSALAGAALTETSRALACTIMSSISRDTVSTASAVLTAAGAAFTAVLRPPGAGGCISASNSQTRGGPSYTHSAQKQRLPQGGIQLVPPSAPPGAEAEGKCMSKPLDPSSPTKGMRLFRQHLRQNTGNAEQLQGKEGLRQLRRRGASGDSAFLRSPPATRTKLRRSQSFLSVCIGHFEAFHRRSCCSLPARTSRSSEPCNVFGESGVRGSITHRVRALSAGAAILQHPQHPLRRPLWRSSRSTSESNSRETEREDTSSSDQEHTQGCEMNEANATWASTREFWEENFGSASSDWRVESPPLQPGHGLLLFVRTCLPPATALLRPRGTTKWHSLGTEWDVAAATSFTGLPEDVPLLLPTDATVTDLVRLLFLTLLERKYMLPLISASPVGEPQLGSSYLDGKTDRPNCRRRKDRSGQTVYSSRVALLRFWLASTHPREHHVEQPLPSAKLAADLRLTSCERLTLAIAPFSLARCGASASAGCLTLTCASRGPPTQKTGYLRGNSTGVQSGAALSPCDAHQCPSEDKRPPSEASPWLLSPLSAWTQDNTLSVETTSPADGEPTLVLRREAGQEPVFRTAEPGDACSQREPCLYVESLFEELRLNSCPTDTEQHEANKRDNDASMCALSEVLKDREPTSASKHTEGIALQGSEQGQEGNIIHSSAGSAASAGTAQRYAGIVQEEEDARLCKPWILQSSVNARQFEYHPAKSNVLLTGNNDGRVRVLDWKRDVVLGTELVDSHPILALSWLKHHPELFVCAAGVSGIPYVVRWREQDDILTNEIKGDRGRMPKASAFHSQSCLPVNMQPRQLAQQRQHVETGDYEVIHDDQYSGDRDDCLDGSTVTAALTWFRRCGRGERLSREGTASLRIVHQYCACEDLSSVSVNSTDDYLLVSGRSADLTIHDVATGARLGTLSGLHSDSINIVRFAHISPHLFVTASFDQTCRLWDLRQRINGHQPLLTVDTGSLSVMCCFDDSDEWLLCSGVDAALRQVCLRSSTVFPQSFAIPPVNAETNFRRAVYLQGGREFITAGTEEGFFRVFSRLGRDLGLVSLEGLLRPFIRERSPQGLATLADLQAELLNLPIYLRSHMALGLSAMSDAALATAAGVSRSSVAAVLRTALRHISGGPAGLLDRELLDRMRQAVNGPGSPWFFIWQQGMRSESRLFQEAGTGSAENDAVEEYVQSLRAHPQERRLVGALLAAKDQVETANGEASYVAMSRLPATMLG